jgi:predicted PurR-regulated permease PerM
MVGTRQQEPAGALMLNLSFHDPRIVGALMLACTALTAVLIPTFFLEVLLTVAMSAVLAPGVARLRRRLRLSAGITVAGIALLVLVFLGIAGYYGVPILIRGINETLTQVPDGLRGLMPFVQEWLDQMRARLEDLFPGDTTFDDFLKKNLPEMAGQNGVVRFALTAIFGSVASLGQFLLFLVLTAILSGEWDKNVDKAHYLLSLFAPRQLPHLVRFGQKFQRYGVELFLGIGIVMTIFVPIFFALLFFYGKLSLGKSVLFGVILGFTSAIPTIGGIITYLILVVVGILNFGLSYDGIRTTAVMYAVAFIVHFAETKFVTPRVLGHRIAFTSFAIITVLVASVLTFGIGRGILAGLFLLVAFKAMVELADEGRQAQGKGERDGPAAGLQPVQATVTPIAPAVSSVGAAGLAKQPPHSKRGRRRGRR